MTLAVEEEVVIKSVLEGAGEEVNGCPLGLNVGGFQNQTCSHITHYKTERERFLILIIYNISSICC